MKIVICVVTLTLTSDDLESHIIMNVSSTLTNTTIWFVAALCFIVDVRTDGRTFLLGLLGHPSGDDLKSGKRHDSFVRWPMCQLGLVMTTTKLLHAEAG